MLDNSKKVLLSATAGHSLFCSMVWLDERDEAGKR